MGQKFYNNNGEIEYTPGYNEYSPLTVTEKLLLKGFRDKPLPPTQPTLPGVDWNKPMTNTHVTPKKLQPTVKPKTELSTGGYIDKEFMKV